MSKINNKIMEEILKKDKIKYSLLLLDGIRDSIMYVECRFMNEKTAKIYDDFENSLDNLYELLEKSLKKIEDEQIKSFNSIE